MSRQGSGVSSRKPRFAPKPALAMTASIRPKWSSVAATIASWADHSVTSHEIASARSGPGRGAGWRGLGQGRPDRVVDYDKGGRVEFTTFTREFFMPRFLERDEALRREPRAPYAWDGVAEVRPFGAMEKTIVEGVY